ncbi:MAG: asparagine--tRNA ligase, partial [Clostridia bacterium]|nr:asparagine--tRNA ligase [Clostridia bacterium]
MKRDLISGIYADPSSFDGKKVTVGGWARSIRDSKAFGFIDLNDGSCFKGVQIVFEREKIENYDQIAKLNVGSSVVVTGTVILTPENKQPFEIKAEKIDVEGESTSDYPLQKKRHTVEYLREQAYLRPRTNLFSAVFRVRSEIAFAIH